MSRLDGRWARVECDGRGQPTGFVPAGTRVVLPVLGVRRHWREWLGALDGEPERDIWQVETPPGVCELHCLRAAGEEDKEEAGQSGGQWIVFRWED